MILTSDKYLLWAIFGSNILLDQVLKNLLDLLEVLSCLLHQQFDNAQLRLKSINHLWLICEKFFIIFNFIKIQVFKRCNEHLHTRIEWCTVLDILKRLEHEIHSHWRWITALEDFYECFQSLIIQLLIDAPILNPFPHDIQSKHFLRKSFRFRILNSLFHVLKAFYQFGFWFVLHLLILIYLSLIQILSNISKCIMRKFFEKFDFEWVEFIGDRWFNFFIEVI